MQLETLCQPNGIDLSAMGGVVFAVHRDACGASSGWSCSLSMTLPARTARFRMRWQRLEMTNHGRREFIS